METNINLIYRLLEKADISDFKDVDTIALINRSRVNIYNIIEGHIPSDDKHLMELFRAINYIVKSSNQDLVQDAAKDIGCSLDRLPARAAFSVKAYEVSLRGLTRE